AVGVWVRMPCRPAQSFSTFLPHSWRRLVEELMRLGVHDRGNDQLIANARLQRPAPGAQSTLIRMAVEEMHVRAIYQMLAILIAAEDGGRDLGAALTGGKGMVPARSSPSFHCASQCILIEGVQPAIVGAVGLRLVELRGGDQLDRQLLQRA